MVRSTQCPNCTLKGANSIPHFARIKTADGSWTGGRQREAHIGWAQQAGVCLKIECSTRQLELTAAVYLRPQVLSPVGWPHGGPMFQNVKAAVLAACAIVLSSAVLLGQTPKAHEAEASPAVDTGASATDVCAGCELPITLRQSVEAGKTAVGTKVQAQLIMATMIKGAVLPRGAVISGEVIESVAKSHDSPSRLAIRMDSAQWKNGEAKFKVYLTSWYYPPAPMPPPNISYTPPGDRRNWGGTDPTVDTTDPPNPAQRMSTQQTAVNAGAPATVISAKRVPIKNVTSASDADGALVLVSSRSNIKLNKVTTYVVAGKELVAGK
jgi:hypothetical protein